MKNAFLTLLAAGLLTACGRTEKAQDNTTQSPKTTADSTAVAQAAKPKNCQSLLKADQLGKANVYQESAKPISVTMTMTQDTSTLQTADGCYFNNSVTVRVAKKSGGQLFKRTLLKEDLFYFAKSDAAVRRAVLQRATYTPTFNGLKYLTLTMRLIEPKSRQTTDYVVFMNYFGEIVKVR